MLLLGYLKPWCRATLGPVSNVTFNVSELSKKSHHLGILSCGRVEKVRGLQMKYRRIANGLDCLKPFQSTREFGFQDMLKQSWLDQLDQFALRPKIWIPI